MNTPIISVKNLIKRYKKADKNSVDDISFDIYPGEFIAFLGPNGAGKTTTISILTTTLDKTSGTVKISGENLEKSESQIRKDIGIIFQKPSLDEKLTVEENIRIHAGLYDVFKFRPMYKLMSEEYKLKIKELLELVGLEAEIHKPVESLSGGMKRKLEIIRSLIHQPKILFLDEPTTGLDPVSRKAIWKYLDKIRKEEKITIFLTTHYLDEAEGCDKIIIINNGKIIMEGKPTELKTKLKEDYLIVETDSKSDLIKELTNLKHSFTLEDSGEFHIDINGPHEAQQTMKKLKTPLTSFKLFQPSLEEAYINLIETK